MKYFLAILAIIVEFFIYLVVCVAMNWKYGGGYFVTLLMFAVYGATWRAITKKRKTNTDITTPQEGSSDSTDTTEEQKY